MQSVAHIGITYTANGEEGKGESGRQSAGSAHWERTLPFVSRYHAFPQTYMYFASEWWLAGNLCTNESHADPSLMLQFHPKHQ